MIAQVDGELFRRQRLVRIERRAEHVAPSAFGTGVKVEQFLPGKFLDARHAEGFFGFILEIDAAQLVAGLCNIAQKHVGNRRNNMKMFLNAAG